MDQSHHLHPLLRDQRTISGIGRSWVDEILWTAWLSPFKKGSDLEEEERERLRVACAERLGAALDHYEQVIGATVPDKLPMPLEVHRRAGEDCPRCGTRIEAIHFKDYVMCYCPRGADRRPGAQGSPPVEVAQMIEVGQQGTGLHPPEPGRRARQPGRPQGGEGRPLLLPQGRHAGVHHAGVRHPRPQRRVRAGRRHGDRRQRRRAEEAAQVRRQARAATFTLVGDPSHDVLEAYGVWVEKKNYGKTYMGIQRATFIIDGDGKVVHVIPKASPKTHDDQVLAALADL